MEPIDAVITWVDGSDPAHARKRAQLLGADAAARYAAADATRFGDCGEIAWCVASLLRFAPWLRRIHIVADAQQPAFMARVQGTPLADRVRVVDHREIFAGYERFLPTFSNRSIEAMLWRVPDLAERFVYLNDDFMLLRPVAPSDFFYGDDDGDDDDDAAGEAFGEAGGVVLRGHWRDTAARERWTRLRARLRALLGRDGGAARVARPSQHAAQQLSARMAGFESRYFQFPHCPASLRRRTIADWFAANPDALERNLAYRLRSAEQFLTVALANHLELAAGHARIDDRLRTLRLQPARQSAPSLRADLARPARDPALAFACVQSLDEATPAVRVQLQDWLTQVIGPPL
jgi:hypothetical protein